MPSSSRLIALAFGAALFIAGCRAGASVNSPTAQPVATVAFADPTPAMPAGTPTPTPPAATPTPEPTRAPATATPVPTMPATPTSTTVRVAPSPTRTATPTVTATRAAASATAAPAVGQATPSLNPRDRSGQPSFSSVAQRRPADVVAYLAGRLADYPGSSSAALLDFSASNILETMDTAVLETIRRDRGAPALQRVYDTIAGAVLVTLRAQYGNRLILVPIDAGHGGKKGFLWDSGSEGTEADHNRAVVTAIVRLAQAPEYARIVLRPVHNDDIADDFGLPPKVEKPIVSQMLMRQARASMLAAEAAAWNRTAATSETAIVVHEISVHFNAGAGGAMVLHQGSTVRADFATRSIDFARRYLERVIADLNATGLLPAPLRRWGGNGLHDDVMMYRPAYFSDDDVRGITLRYSALQGGGYLPRYTAIVLGYSANR